MGESKEDQESRKRKTPWSSSSQHYTFQNAFASYAAASATFSPPISSSGLPNNVFSPDDGDGHDHKKSKTHAHLSASATTLNSESFSSLSSDPSSPSKEALELSASPGFSTPISMSGKFLQSCPSSISPSSVLSSQNSMNTTASGPSAPAPSSSNKEYSLYPREDVSHGDQLDSAMAQRLFGRATTKYIFDNLKIGLQPILVKRLKELSQSEPTPDVGIEMADSAYLLKLLNSWNAQLEIVGKKAGLGAKLLQKGMELIEEAQAMLKSSVFESSTSGV